MNICLNFFLRTKVNLPPVHDDFEKSPAVSRKVKQSLFKPVYPEQSKVSVTMWGMYDNLVYVVHQNDWPDWN